MRAVVRRAQPPALHDLVRAGGPPASAQVLPPDIRDPLVNHPRRASLLEVRHATAGHNVVLPATLAARRAGARCVGGNGPLDQSVPLQVIIDLGRRPEARFLGVSGGEYLRQEQARPTSAAAPARLRLQDLLTQSGCGALQISWEDLKDAEAAVGEFGGDNRAGDLPVLQTMLPCAAGSCALATHARSPTSGPVLRAMAAQRQLAAPEACLPGRRRAGHAAPHQRDAQPQGHDRGPDVPRGPRRHRPHRHDPRPAGRCARPAPDVAAAGRFASVADAGACLRSPPWAQPWAHSWPRRAVPNSVLFLGRPGVGKTTVVREMARVLADDLHKRVVIVDTSNEIGGDGDVRPQSRTGAQALRGARTSSLQGASGGDPCLQPGDRAPRAGAGAAPGHRRRAADAGPRPLAAAPRDGARRALPTPRLCKCGHHWRPAHARVGRARRAVAAPMQQDQAPGGLAGRGRARAQVEAVENHMPEVVIVDEIGTEAEALACRSIAERGVQLIGTAHGQVLENLMKNPTLSDLIGGIQSVTLGALPAAPGRSRPARDRRRPARLPARLLGAAPAAERGWAGCLASAVPGGPCAGVRAAQQRHARPCQDRVVCLVLHLAHDVCRARSSSHALTRAQQRQG